MPPGHVPFAVFNRTANPVLRMVLSSPLHPLVSRHLALITVTGRRSGRRHTFPVAYREEGNRVNIDVGWPERKHWWRNLQEEPRVEIRIHGRQRGGVARVVGDVRTGVNVEVDLEPERPNSAT